MDLKCLVKLLLEKEIIKEEETILNTNKNVTVKSFYFGYQEVLEKIKTSKYDKNKVYIDTGNIGRTFVIINKNHLKTMILNESNETHFYVNRRKLFNCISSQTFNHIFKNDEDIYTLMTIDNDLIEVRNLKKEREEKEKYNRKKNEVLDFLNQLP